MPPIAFKSSNRGLSSAEGNPTAINNWGVAVELSIAA